MRGEGNRGVAGCCWARMKAQERRKKERSGGGSVWLEGDSEGSTED
jgi:hypothetical protein